MHLKVYLFLLFYALYCNSSPAQSPVVFNGQPNPYTLLYEDTSGDTLPFVEIKTKCFVPLTQTFTALRNAERPLIVTWLKFRIQNTSLTDTGFGICVQYPCLHYLIQR